MTNRLAFMGAGNIARAIIGGLVTSGYPAGSITAADPSAEQLRLLPAGVVTGGDNRAAAADADVIVFCVKPNLVAGVAAGIAPAARGKLVITVAAGIPVGVLQDALGADAPVIRCMPNTPALVGRGMTGLYATAAVSAAQRETGEAILGAVGRTLWFDAEEQLDVVTAVSGSGPAYFFLVMESIEKAGIALGLAPEVARALVLQTALGAAEMAATGTDAPGTLRQRVTSPGGTTEAAITSLLESGLPDDFVRAIRAAWRRSQDLAATAGS